MILFDSSWNDKLHKEFDKPYFKQLDHKIQLEVAKGKLVLPFPYNINVFKAFELTPLSTVKVVILGQDPYPNQKDAMGLAFSVPAAQGTPKSLGNMFKELKSDLGIINKTNDLTFWAAQGVFLLNTILTVNVNESNSHKGFGWETFTDKVIEIVCQNKEYVIFWLLGKEAQAKEQLILDSSKYKVDILKMPHPSPFSAHKGFFFSKPFSKTNELLIKNKMLPVNWKL